MWASESLLNSKALKACVRFAIFNFIENVQNIFKIGLQKLWSDYTKIALREKYLEIKNSKTSFCCCYVKLATVQIRGQTNSLWVVQFNSDQKEDSDAHI